MDNFYRQLADQADRLYGLIQKFSQPKILVVGDLTLDEFVTGQTERISREAPVLIIRHEYTKQVPGGGANAVYNLAKLGGRVAVVGLIGEDDQGRALKEIFQASNIDTSGLVVDPSRPTVTKSRISAHARQSVTQQIVRIDRKSDVPPSAEIQDQLVSAIRAKINQVSAVVCSDYGEGVLQAPIIQAALQHPLTIVDSQKNLHRYYGASIFTPNLPEAELAVGYSIHSDNLDRAASDLCQLTGAKQMLITRGEEGMSLFQLTEQGLDRQDIPAFNRTQVFDVTGAGDTVVAALTLALANQADYRCAAILGNLAASIVVRQFGTTTTTATELTQALTKLLESAHPVA
jgi:rfaE bifunctional protein kinase chain/domain